jgi:hypothetical protein
MITVLLLKERNGLCIGVFNWVGIIIEMLLHNKQFDKGYVLLVAVVIAIHPISSNQKQPLSSPLNEPTH